MKTLHTIGYEGADLKDFIRTLEVAGVDCLVDIRELPVSRRRGFSKKALSAALAEHGIAYQHIKSLGDPKEGRDAMRSGHVERFKDVFLRHLASAEAQEGLRNLADIAAERSAALLCYERDHGLCHRSLVAHALAAMMPLKIVHIGVRKGLANASRQGEVSSSS